MHSDIISLKPFPKSQPQEKRISGHMNIVPSDFMPVHLLLPMSNIVPYVPCLDRIDVDATL